MLRVHRAERADRLAEALTHVLVEPLTDPFAHEVVAVPTRGVERWLSQRLSVRLGASPSGGDGVCANVEFPFPGHLVGGAIAAVSRIDREADPWSAQHSAWALLDTVGACAGEPWLDPLTSHLERTGANARLSVVRHIADLFDGYGVHRPAMVRTWAAGDDLDGAGQPLPADVAWQAELWRRLRDRLGMPSPAERLAGACDVLAADPSVVDLPARVSLFGLTRLPASYLDVLRALAAGRHIHLFLLHPSPGLWDTVTTFATRPAGVVARAADTTAALPRHPLLRTWGRDAREMQLVLGDHPDQMVQHHGLHAEPTTLLGRIQADVRADRQPPGEPVADTEEQRPVLGAGDRSVQVHSCHGRARQVEVVRDAILHLLADDPSLEPRDVIVMCHDIESFAPLIHATFGLGERFGAGGEAEGAGDAGRAGAPDLRVRLADRSLRQTNPLLGVVAELLELASSRVSASQVVDLASREPVRRRFDLDDDDVARLDEWIATAGVRWGLDAEHRHPFGLARVPDNTWRAGLDRLLLGVAMAEDGTRLVGGVLPVDDVDSSDIDLAGRLVELVDRLGTTLDELAGPHPIAAWVAALAAAADRLGATGDDEAWQRTQLQAVLDDVVVEATAGEGVDGTVNTTALTLAEVKALLAERLRGRPTRANFRTGHLTMCTLVPMRSVPHRVVCLLGLDDGVFPRRAPVDGDDLVQRDPWVGDRDARSEDRQLLLDALMAATDHLVITYTGRDERTNVPRPPAVPVGELLDVVDRTVRLADGRAARSAVVTSHPLQPFDQRNFAAGLLAPAGPWSFDPVALAGAEATAGPRRPPAPFLAGPLPPLPADVIALEDLERFVQHPVKAFLRQRLGIHLTTDDDEPADELPVDLDPLERWAVGQRLLEARLAGIDPVTARAAEAARGSLPPGALGGPFLDGVAREVEAILAEIPPAPGVASASVEVVVELPGGRTLVGTVAGVFGHEVRSVVYSRLGPKHRLTAWVRLLALTAADPDRPFCTFTAGRGSRDNVAVARIGPLGPDTGARRRAALDELGRLLDLHSRGMREPLPLYCKTSAAYAAARAAGKDGARAVADAWITTGGFSCEDQEPEHAMVLGGSRRADRLLEPAPAGDEHGPGWATDETSRFGRLARRLWDPLLAVEELAR